MATALLVLITAPNPRVARSLARALVSERLAACVNLVPAVQSVYRWQGKVESAREVLLLVKTTRRGYPTLERRVRTLHPYEVPEVIALPVDRGSAPYLAWLKAQVGTPRRPR